MNENINNLVNAIASGDALKTENSFAAAMAQIVSNKLEDMRVNVAQNMFNSAVNESDDKAAAKAEKEGHKTAKHVAKQIAASHKNLRVTSDDNTHYVHHKDDEDGNESLAVHHEGGKIHLTHEAGTSGYHHETHDNPDHAIESGKKIANGE